MTPPSPTVAAPWLVRLATLHRRIEDPGLSVLVVVLLGVDFVLTPVQATGLVSARLEVSIGGLALAGAALCVVRGRATALVAIVLLVASALAGVPAGWRPISWLGAEIGTDLAARSVLLCLLLVVVGRSVFAPGRVTVHRVLGAVAIYLQIPLIFAAAYSLLALRVPGAFRVDPADSSALVGAQSLYFSFVSLTSVGYGDIVPVHPIARSLANLEAAIGQLYPATIIARLLTLQGSGGR